MNILKGKMMLEIHMLTHLLEINSNYNVKEMKMLTEISIEKSDNN